MKYFQHRFEEVQNYLHHRSPYLMVDRVISIESNEILSEKTVSGDEFFMKGHFPGAPIFPGAMMQELSTQTGGILIAAEHNPMEQYNTEDPFFNEYALGVLVKVQQARYKGFARPGDVLSAKVVLDENLNGLFEFSASISLKGKTIMRNRFQLMNIRTQVLQGPQPT